MQDRAEIVKSLDLLAKQWIRTCGLEKGFDYTVVEKVVIISSQFCCINRDIMPFAHQVLSINLDMTFSHESVKYNLGYAVCSSSVKYKPGYDVFS